jgi:hypothetical protein
MEVEQVVQYQQAHPAPALIEAAIRVLSAVWILTPERQLAMDNLEWCMSAEAVPMVEGRLGIRP